jgi:hypothetical protein
MQYNPDTPHQNAKVVVSLQLPQLSSTRENQPGEEEQVYLAMPTGFQ